MKCHNLLTYEIITFLSTLFSLSSCIINDQNGYPKKVHFSSQGGSEMISGNYDCYLYIYDENDDANGKGLTYETDTVEYTWLKVIRLREGKPTFEFIATPNDNPKQRKLRVYLGFGTEYGEISVTQQGR